MATPAPAGTTLGARTECKLPFELAIPAKWGEAYIGTEFGTTFSAAGVPLMCEVDATPAGVNGWLRIWYADSGTEPKAALTEFVAGNEMLDPRYRETKVDDESAWEVLFRSPKTEDTPEAHGRAFALRDGGRLVIVGWIPIDEPSYTAGLPGYLLAKNSFAR